MEASCASSSFNDQSTEPSHDSQDFCYEVPIINLDIKKSEVDILFVNNNLNAETSKNVTTEPIVIEETDDIVVVQKKDEEDSISIVIDDEEKANMIKDIDLEIVALDAEINNEIMNKTDKSIKEIDTTIDLDEETDNVIVLSGNRTDSDVIILDGNKTDSETTIILNDDENNITQNKHTDVIDVEKDTECSIVENSVIYDETIKEFNELVKKCLSMKNSVGMPRVINRTLLVIYKNVDETFKKSEEFRKAIVNTLTLLDVEPEKKFSHIKNLCQFMKFHKIKKKVPFITLDKRKEKELSTIIPTKRTKLDDVIDLDDDSTKDTQCGSVNPRKNNYPIGKVYPPIDLDSSDGEVIEDDVILINKENTETVKNINSKKPNRVTVECTERSKKNKSRKVGRPRKYASEKQTIVKSRKVGRPRKCASERQNTSKFCQNINIENGISDPGMLLEPRMSVNVEIPDFSQAKTDPGTLLEPIMSVNAQIPDFSQAKTDPGTLLEPRMSVNAQIPDFSQAKTDPGTLLEPRMSVNVEIPDFSQAKIEAIERRIGNLKSQLEKLEEAEVVTDSNLSPYIACEQIKRYIVQLYKRLCQITGTEVTKRHKVRLQVAPGHAEGPVRCLEEFLNENIDVDGNPPFPDMSDVTQCVCNANYKYNLMWNQGQIMNEAQALFKQLGQSMQKRRQKREWKDLMSLVKSEVTDPADEDPVLQARLEENKRIAKRNELDLLDRFAKMEDGTFSASEQGLRLRVHESDESDEDSDAQYPGDNTDATDIQNSRPEITETAPSEVNGESVKTAPENVERPLNELNPIGIHLHGDVTVSNNGDNIKYGSTISANRGEIIIQPTIQYLPDKNENPNTHFSSEYKRFLNNRAQVLLASKITIPKNKLIRNTEATPEINSSIQNMKCNETYFERAAKIAEDILSLVQSDLGTGGLANDNYNHIANSISTVRLTKLNLNDAAKNNKLNINLAHSSLTSDNSNLRYETTEVPAHAALCKDVNTDEEIIKSIEPSKTSDNLTSNVLEKEKEVKTEVLDVIKPEPLDIPRMLEELGEGFTATIFDIEDPFLVIEISDSSESEDEDNLEA